MHASLINGTKEAISHNEQYRVVILDVEDRCEIKITGDNGEDKVTIPSTMIPSHSKIDGIAVSDNGGFVVLVTTNEEQTAKQVTLYERLTRNVFLSKPLNLDDDEEIENSLHVGKSITFFGYNNMLHVSISFSSPASYGIYIWAKKKGHWVYDSTNEISSI